MDAISLSHIEQISRWFQKAVPEPTDQNVHAQIGVHLEEVSEMLHAMIQSAQTPLLRDRLTFSFEVLNHIQGEIKSFKENHRFDTKAIDREALLDALCDQIVTAVGVAHMLKLDIIGGLKAVADSNDSKFGDDGEPIFNENKKIMKGPNYKKPILGAFV